MTEPADPEVVLAELARLPIGEALGRDHLARLADKSLLELQPSDQNPGVIRYDVLETVREYAVQLLSDALMSLR